MSVFTAPAVTTDPIDEACGGDGLAGALNALDDAIALRATLASPTFTGTVTVPTPFTIGAISMTSTGTELNLLDGATTPTRTGALVLATTPTLVTPVLGVATATTINKVTITAPATASTLTLAQGSSLITAGAYAITLTSTGATGVTLPTTGTLSAIAGTETLTNKNIVQKVTTYTPAGAATATLDVSVGAIHAITMPAGNITIAISNEAAGKCFLVEITQDDPGSRTVTWFTTIKWAGGSAPTLTTTADKRDVFGFRVTAADQYDGFIVGQNI